MFEPSAKPRIFGAAPGVDFATGLVDGLCRRGAAMDPAMDPAAWARTEIYVNTTRMQRRIRAVFDAGPAQLLPRVRLVTDLALDPVSVTIPPPVSPLYRRLELAQLVTRLLDSQPDLAPRTALYDLSDSLAALMDEMQGEGVSPDAIKALDVTDQSGHWQRAHQFLDIVAPFFGETPDKPDKEARQRLVIMALAARWKTAPPAHPVIVAGSTGSRGATALFMQAVAGLPQGALVLPGFDFDMPQGVWDGMADAMTAEDHPQYRYRRLMDLIGFDRDDVQAWSDLRPARPARNKLVSLSLRPAPVTSQWLAEGPDLGDLLAATEGLTLLEAASPRAEAETIALRLRQAAQDGQTAALISPDRMLTRQVTAALDRWDITPDDSAGLPLALSPPGRFLRHVADLFGKPLTGEALLTLLKHPLCHSDRSDRGAHLRHGRELELHLRRNGPPFPTADTLHDWAGDKTDRQAWVAWLAPLVTGLDAVGTRPLRDHLAAHMDLAAGLAAGPDTTGAGGLWAEAAGREARRICDMLCADADAGGPMAPRDYAAFFGGVISEGVVRDRDKGHPGILIWGTLEARVQGVDLAILGGMNDGSWPEAPPPDPWLNRTMRKDAGLLLPERRIGLSAHDYQQAMAGPEVWITRAKRTADAETVPSRWLNRLMNLLGGLAKQNGPQALAVMKDRGDLWAAKAALLGMPDAPLPPATRPAPCPPVAARPRKISVTQVKTLIRDPYAIYARYVLRLSDLDPLARSADPALRGVIIHKILERFIGEGHGPDGRDALLAIANREFAAQCPWPAIRMEWLVKFVKAADQFLTGETERQALAETRKVEQWGEITLPAVGVTLTCKADRIDLTPDGRALIYDYKTGQVPSKDQQKNFDKQLLLEAEMVTRGAFAGIGARDVDGAQFIGIKPEKKITDAPLQDQPADEFWADFEKFLAHWQQVQRGYTARMALFSKDDFSAYDHLSRYGEWDTSVAPDPVVLT